MATRGVGTLLGACIAAPLLGFAALAGDAQRRGDGQYLDGAGNPTYHVAQDGTVDWFTYDGFRRYGASCIHCHGPDGLGSTFAPPMTDSLKTLSYADFYRIVAGGTRNVSGTVQSVMPPFGGDPNIRCHIDAIYVYLKARAEDRIPRGRPSRKEPQTEAARDAEQACLGPLTAR
jgi:methanol metabolism-related c-type cytochrome